MKRAGLAAFVAVLVLVGSSLAFAGGVYRGTNDDDVIRGSALRPRASVIYGLRGDDRIWGAKGFDTLYGGPGDDRLHAFHASTGKLVGGPGYDKCVVGVNRHGDFTVTIRSCEVILKVPKQGHGG